MTQLKLITEEQLDKKHLASIRGTTDRRAAGDFYLLRLHPAMKRRLRVHKWAAVIFEHPISKVSNLENFPVDGESAPKPSDVSGFLVVHCRVSAFPAASGDEGSAEIDQTLRNSLGIPWAIGAKNDVLKIYVYPASKAGGIGEAISKWLGRRHIFFRVCRSSVGDAEKNFARVPAEYFDVLGMRPGDRIVVERPICNSFDRRGRIRSFKITRHSIKAHVATRSYLEERERSQKYDKRRYFPTREYLYDLNLFKSYYSDDSLHSVVDDNDIPSIFFDSDFRSIDGPEFGMTPLTAVSVRRGLLDIFVREFQDFGLAFAIAAIPVFQGIKGLFSNGGHDVQLGYIGIGLSIPLIVLGMIAWRIRRQII